MTRRRVGARRTCDGRDLLGAFRAAVANLEAHADEINALNVYPVPDGDTGSNMVATVRAALAEAERVAEPSLDRVAGAIAFGALMGARGNSGVITSQIFRGMADAVDGKRRANGLDLARALTDGSRTAYRAVAKPVEGTILTVIREASEAAVGAAESAVAIEAVLTVTVATAAIALAKTPTLLPILRDAGVVDAGGAGLARLFEGALFHTVGSATASRGLTAQHNGPGPGPRAGVEDLAYGYETMYVLHPPSGASLDVERVRAALETMGASVLVAGDARALKVHVHSERPDEIIAYGLAQGTLSRISVENLDAQARDARERRARAFTSDDTAGVPDDDAPAAATATTPARAAASRGSAAAAAGGDDPMHIAVIAVTAGDGLAAVFRSFGCSRIVSGGQSANPSTGELLEAVDAVAAQHVILLPNNPSVVLAARQVAQLSSRPVTVIPTRNAAEGLAAMLALDASASVEENAAAMALAGRAIQSLQVTRAVREASVGEHRVKRGSVIVLDPEDGLVAADPDETTAVLGAIRGLRPGYELLTLYYGEDTGRAAAEALGRQIGEEWPDVEVEIVRGGQPHYRYLIAAE